MPIRILKCLAITCVLLAVVASGRRDQEPIDRVVNSMNVGFAEFAAATVELEAAVDRLDRDSPRGAPDVREALKRCRLQYKRIEFFLEYFFDFAARAFNAPPKIEVEEPSMEFNEPAGFQVVEALLFQDDPFLKKGEMAEQARFIASSAADLHALLYGFKGNDRQLLESVRLELIRVMTLTIAGFDAPLLKTGIQESFESLSAMRLVLEPWVRDGSEASRAAARHLEAALRYLQEHPDFDSFNRLAFLSDHALPLQSSLQRLGEETGLQFNTVPALNDHAENLYGSDALRPDGFSTDGPRHAFIMKLGRSLFFEKKLSGDGSRSCATCHDPAKYFTDGLARSQAFDGKSVVARNAPTLLYAAFQHSQFWDGRVRSLEDQAKAVLRSPCEMNASPTVVVRALMEDSAYVSRFREAFSQEQDSLISIDRIAHSIASFIRTLRPFDSPFDRYMHGNRSALSASQIDGFNLFMGKAGCGTCHFAPMFNGLVPPLYSVTEFESLGVPQTRDLDRPLPDADAGRYAVFGIDFQKGAFKTPTLRNVAMTAPYMHNGSFASLDDVMDFYDRGGGAGIGMDVPNQTLPAQPLNLTARERSDIIEFLKALTDSVPAGYISSTLSTQP